MQIEYDRRADAAYITLADRPVASTRELDSRRLLDFDAEGVVVGIELLSVRQGVDVAGLPSAEQVAALLEQRDIRVFA